MAMAGMTVTDERLESVNFSTSYAKGIQSVIVKEDSEYTSFEDFYTGFDADGNPAGVKEGIKIGVQQDTTGDIYSSSEPSAWGFGEDNCGNETNLSVKGDIRRNGNRVETAKKDFLLDIVGRYTVTIGGKSYDTVCVMDIETYNCGVVSEQFLDKNGKTILWRRYNRDDWAIDRYKKTWSEQLPENDRLTVNGTTYVHWYDCITDYIF